MAKETIEALVDGGEASAGPPLGPQLGPLGVNIMVNIMEIVNAINDKTQKFQGMKVPIKLTLDTETKEYEITVGTPPTTALIKEKLGIDKGSGSPATHKVADIGINEIMQIADMKDEALLGKDPKMRAKEVMGTCVSMGITVDGKDPREAQKVLDEGEYDSFF
ncbi:MAG: 50S ribosomal protein L11 [Thermoplasmata archaeon]